MLVGRWQPREQCPVRSLDQLEFDNTFSRLPGDFYTRVRPQPLRDPCLVAASAPACELLGLAPSAPGGADFLACASGAALPAGADPLAMVYSGHQFGAYNPRLGDGRGLLLGEVRGPAGKWDLHLKGAGKTPYSRQGDGRAVLRSSIREFLASEAMHALGIPSSRALCVVGSSEPVWRESRETGATVIRLAQSHVRFGSFEYFHYTGRHDCVRRLADYVIEQHFPQLAGEADRHRELLREAVHRTARLVAHWQAIGFAHGVLNSDNMSILGLSFDYGPYGFLDDYEPGFICNHSDHSGRYAFNRQPHIGLWNLNALAHAFSSLLHEATLRELLGEYEGIFVEHYLQLMRNRLGLLQPHPGDAALLQELLDLMARARVDYTLFLRELVSLESDAARSPLRDFFLQREEFDAWARRYCQRLRDEGSAPERRRALMLASNPRYILRNYLAQQAIERAEGGDFSEVRRLLRALQAPFEERPEFADYAAPAPDWGKRLEISCSS